MAPPCKHRHIVEMGLSLLSHASMPLKFWDETFATTTYLINRLPSHVINFSSPFEKLFGSTLGYAWLKVFGCAYWPHFRPYNTRKLEFSSNKCVFLGYSSCHKGYKCLDVATGRVYISRDVVFDESVFPFSTLHPNAGAQLYSKIQLLPPTLCNSIGDDLVDGLMANGVNPVAEHIVVQVEEVTDVQVGEQTEQESNGDYVDIATDPAPVGDPSESASDAASCNRLGLPWDRAPDQTKSSKDPMPISNDPDTWQQQMAPTPGFASGMSGSGMQLRSGI
jgi:hypothetical protein